MTVLSNELADLAERVKEANRLSDVAQQQSVEKALEAGHLLIEAKAAVQHGEWLPFLVRADIPERHAQRLMQIARSGLKSAQVSDLGGIKATLKWLQDLRLPIPGMVLLVTLGDFAEDNQEPMGFVWQESAAGFHVAMIDIRESSPHIICTKRPLGNEQGVIATLIRVLDYRLAEMSFMTVDETVGGIGLPALCKEIAEGSA